MTRRRFVQLLLLIVLAVAPFGRIGVSQAMTGQPRMAMNAHCGGGQPMSDGDRSHRMAVDCMLACAGMATACAQFALPPPAPAAAPVALATPFPPGIRPVADPPPPRSA